MVKKIKVMFIVDFIYALTGGTENQLVRLINNLDKCKYEISLLVLRDSEWVRKNIANLDCQIKIFHTQKLKNPKVIYSFVTMYFHIKRIRPDIVMTFFDLSNIMGVIISKLARCNFIVSSRRDFGLWIDRSDFFMLRIANRFVNRIVTNAKIIKTLVIEKEKCDASNIEVIYNGIDSSKFRPNSDKTSQLKKYYGVPDNAAIIGIVGGLKPMKQHFIFLQAAREVVAIEKDVHFVIVGDGPLRGNLETTTEALHLTDNVTFVGSQTDILPFLGMFNIAVNCSANEGLSNAIMEYMAYGIPTIVSDAGGNAELIQNGVNGYTFELGNKEMLSRKILDLLIDTRRQSEFVTRSKDIINSQFNIETMIQAYDRLFTEAVNPEPVLDVIHN